MEEKKKIKIEIGYIVALITTKPLSVRYVDTRMNENYGITKSYKTARILNKSELKNLNVRKVVRKLKKVLNTKHTMLQVLKVFYYYSIATKWSYSKIVFKSFTKPNPYIFAEEL